jgi:beta-N-acetylhexosaminidase
MKLNIKKFSLISITLLSSFYVFHAYAQSQNSIPDFNQFIVAPVETVEDTDNMAGVIFFKNDFEDNAQIMCQTKKKMIHTLMMTDQENGTIYRIEQAKLPSFEQSSTPDYEKNLTLATTRLKNLCLDVDLAPVVEPSYDGKRSSHNQQDALNQAQKLAQSLRSQAIIPTWKHFPGINFNQQAIDKNSEFAFFYSFIQAEANLALMNQDEILAYTSEFKNNKADLIMVSNNIYPQIDKEPAVLSSWFIQKAKENQPDSLLITDDVSELKLTSEMIVKLFDNTDFILVTSEKDKKRIIATLKKAYENHQINNETIIEKLDRIKQWKKINNLS